MHSAVDAMLPRFNIVMIPIDIIVFQTKFLFFSRYLPDDLYHSNYHVEELLEINTLFVSVLLLFATSTIFLVMV